MNDVVLIINSLIVTQQNDVSKTSLMNQDILTGGIAGFNYVLIL